MFKEMRRHLQKLSLQENKDILTKATSGVLAVSGEDGYPYAVPMSFAFDHKRLIFHCAKTGHKLESVLRNDKVSFCVIDQDIIIPKEYTTYFRSVIVFGRTHILLDEKEKQKAFEILAAKYSPNDQEGRLAEIHKLFKQTVIFVLDIEYMSGKESIELKNKT